MTDHWQERLQAEAEELQARIEKLAAFTRGSEFAAMTYGERALLVEQLGQMSCLMATLMRRIELSS